MKTKTKKTTATYKWTAPKKRNPTDITLRNLRAMKKTIERHEQRLDIMALDLAVIFQAITPCGHNTPTTKRGRR